jgi:hypothetical protein
MGSVLVIDRRRHGRQLRTAPPVGLAIAALTLGFPSVSRAQEENNSQHEHDLDPSASGT